MFTRLKTQKLDLHNATATYVGQGSISCSDCEPLETGMTAFYFGIRPDLDGREEYYFEFENGFHMEYSFMRKNPHMFEIKQ